jgi:dephospho-CoA kinase
LVLKEKYGENLIVIATYAPPEMRYKRLENRAKKHGEDNNLRFRSFNQSEAAARDKAEIENLHKAGPIAMADYTILNTKKIIDLQKQINEIFTDIYGQKSN